MRVFSIYNSMEESAKLCPNGQNIKMLIRHSIRQEIRKDASIEEIKNAQLTREGKKMAERLGESFNIDIGTISSSYSQRCIDTCREIINGFNKNHIEHSHAVLKTEILQCPHLKNENTSEEHESWEKLGIEGIFDRFAKDVYIPGFHDLETSANRMINYILETGNKNNTIDIFCTHDFQLAMLLLFFHEKRYEYKQVLFNGDDNWPYMLEGMFLWRTKNNFNVLWRGEKMKNPVTSS